MITDLENSPTVFETTPIDPDDPLLERPFSPLALDLLVEAARILTEYPVIPEIQKYRRHVVSLRITPEEFEELLESRGMARAAELNTFAATCVLTSPALAIKAYRSTGFAK